MFIYVTNIMIVLKSNCKPSLLMNETEGPQSVRTNIGKYREILFLPHVLELNQDSLTDRCNNYFEPLSAYCKDLPKNIFLKNFK